MCTEGLLLFLLKALVLYHWIEINAINERKSLENPDIHLTKDGIGVFGVAGCPSNVKLWLKWEQLQIAFICVNSIAADPYFVLRLKNILST